MDDMSVETWAYAGRRWLKERVTYCWFELDEDGKLKKDGDRYYSKNITPDAYLGAVFEVHLKREDGKDFVITGGAKKPLWKERLADAEVTRHWYAQDLDAARRRETKAALTKASKVTPFDDVIAPLRQIAPTLTSGERRALAVRIMEVLWT